MRPTSRQSNELPTTVPSRLSRGTSAVSTRQPLSRRLIFLAGGLFAAAVMVLAGACNARADASKYTVTVDPVEVKAGEEAKATVNFKPGPKFKWNLEYPARLTVKGDTGNVDMEQVSFRKKDFQASDESASLVVPVRGRMAGSEIIEAEAKISVCNDTTCLIETVPVRIPVDVVP